MSLGSFFHDSKDHPGAVVVGAKGMLGRAVCQLLTNLEIPFEAVDYNELDISCPDSIKNTALDMRSVWINCAAWTDVDGAEENEDQALAINGGDGLKALCTRIKEASGLLVHVSTGLCL